MSDYGHSTGRIASFFFGILFLFATIYYVWALAAPPGIISNMLSGQEGPVPGWLVPFRALYFSSVTMTTLGFGDMHANCLKLWGHILLTLQVFSGYVILSALITRFAVLFSAGGPADKFSRTKK